jgi:hypothetical protein
MEIFFSGGPLGGSSRQWDGELPQYITFAEPVQPGGGFQRGYIYEKAIDNLGVELDNPPQAEYRFVGDTTHGELTS